MTMLGIVISIVAVILSVSIGEGVKQQIGNQAARYGDNVLMVQPNTAAQTLVGSGLPGGVSSLLRPSDLTVVRNTPDVSAAVPLSALKGAVHGDRVVENPLVIATTPELSTILKQDVQYGGFFSEPDGHHVAVLGAAIARQLFDDTAPLGQKCRFRGHEFVVSGVFKPFPAAPFSLEANYNDAVFIPYGAAQEIYGESPAINQIFVQTTSAAVTKTVETNLAAALKTAHGDANDVVVMAPGTKATSSSQTLQLMTMMTAAIAVVALLVGGVGIMNMMLVTVTERIHEIGIRKAIGASNQQILRQFMTEAFALCIIGALVGVLVSFGAIGLLRIYTSLQPAIVWPVVLLAPCLAMAVGVFFGTIPALKAARMDPIEALRHE
jgi:putative ABC transport system permease protein